jgi:hypothetical protein
MQAAGQGLTWYEVLGVPPAATVEEIRAAYRQAALRLHPDKAASSSRQQQGLQNPPPPAPNSDFLLVQQAWEVLQDGARRAEYDRQLALAAAAQQVHVNETVMLREMGREELEGQPCHAWPCRCGGAFLLLDDDAAAAEGGELLVPCTTCSLHTRVLTAPPNPAG